MNPTEKTYRIKPLKWESVVWDSRKVEQKIAKVPLGRYIMHRSRHGSGPWCDWFWVCEPDDYVIGTKDHQQAASLRHCKAAAEAHYRASLEQALEVVE